MKISEETIVGLLFLVLLFALPSHYVVMRLEAEPWPAIVMPSFQGAGPRDDVYTTRVPEVWVRFEESTHLLLATTRLLNQLPQSHHIQFMLITFSPAAQTSPAAGRTSRGAYSGTWVDARKRWLHTRINTLYPDRDVHRVDIVWTEIRREILDGQVRKTTTPLDTLTIRL